MELTDLKKTWNKMSANRELDEDQLKAMLGKRTKNLIERIERNIKVGFLVLLALFVLVALYDLPGSPLALEEASEVPGWILFLNGFSYTLIFTTFIFFAVRYYRVKKSCDVVCDLKKTLKKIIETIKLFQRLFYLALGSLTITMVLGFIAGIFQASSAKIEGRAISFSDIQMDQLLLEIGIGLGFIIVVVGGIFVFLRWGFRRLYGNYYHKLKTTLMELEEIGE